jgi:metallo-beta-lactamase family protein
MIPSFAVGRTQDILFHLGCLHYQGELDNWEVFLDSPMAIAITRVYDRWLGMLNGDDVRQLSEVQKTSLEKFLPTLNLAMDTEESMAINRIKGGAIHKGWRYYHRRQWYVYRRADSPPLQAAHLG